MQFSMVKNFHSCFFSLFIHIWTLHICSWMNNILQFFIHLQNSIFRFYSSVNFATFVLCNFFFHTSPWKVVEQLIWFITEYSIKLYQLICTSLAFVVCFCLRDFCHCWSVDSNTKKIGISRGKVNKHDFKVSLFFVRFSIYVINEFSSFQSHFQINHMWMNVRELIIMKKSKFFHFEPRHQIIFTLVSQKFIINCEQFFPPNFSSHGRLFWEWKSVY